MSERKRTTARKAVAPKKSAAAQTTAGKTVAKGRRPAVDGSGSPPRSASAEPSPSEARLACPRCGTATFGPEERIRAEGRRTVRYTVLVCERGHTFARPVTRAR